MVNIILTSEMRVGSRWIHYLLRDLLNMKVSGELDAREIPACRKLVNQRFKENRIVKFHHAKVDDILQMEGNYKIIGIVRNPRDRMVSWAFHQRFKPSGQGLKEIKNAISDKEAVKVCVSHPMARKHNKDQFALMIRDVSTRRYLGWGLQRYIWTSYEWLLNDLFGEITTIVKFLGLNIDPLRINRICNQHSFKSRSGRESGQESRANEWFRKGVNDDYIWWFDIDMLKETDFEHKEYWKIIKLEEKG